MTIKLFISYFSEDKNKMKALNKAIMKMNNQFETIIVANRKNPGELLTDKVKNGILESNYFIPIITRNSITSQWVNQEIGFAIAKNKDIIPIIEKEIIPMLKGFIHNQMDLPFTFKGYELENKKEASSFRRCYNNFLNHLNDFIIIESYFKSDIVPKKVKQGQIYKTKVNFKGKLKNGFFDNFVRHSSGWYIWQWDKDTLKNGKHTTPGELHGIIDTTKEYEHSTNNWPKGKYHIHVQVYDHLIPGEVGRRLVIKEVHDFEII